MAFEIDLAPRIVIHAPGGDVVVDPWAGDTSAQGGVVNIGGVSMPYEVVWGAANLPPASQQLGFESLASGAMGYLPWVLLGVGAFLVLRK